MNAHRRFTTSTSRQDGRRARCRPCLESLEDRTLLSTIYGLTPGNVLIRFDSANPGAVTTIGTISGLGANQTVRGIDFRPRTGQLYASAVTTASVANSIIFTYRVNPFNAQATLVGQTAAALPFAADVPTGYDFNPTVDLIRYVNANDNENARLNPNTGGLQGNDTDLTFGADIIAEAYDRNWNRQIIITPTSNNAIPTTLYAIERNTSGLYIQGGINGDPSPNGGVLSGVAPLGFALNQTRDGGFDINARGQAFAALTDDADDLTRLYSINLFAAANAATSLGLIGNGQTEVRSIAIAPEGILVAGSGAGGPPRVRAYDAVTGALKFNFLAFGTGFTGGVRVAAGDVNGDGVSDIVTVSGPGIVSRVRAFDGKTGAMVFDFAPFGNANRKGVFVAAGDVNADGWDDIITGADVGAAPRVNVFSGRTGGIIASFLAYGAAAKNGVHVAAADFDLNGTAEIVTARGNGRGLIRIFNHAGAPWVATPPAGVLPPAIPNSFNAFGPAVTSGAYVAAGDVTGDGFADIIAGVGKPASSRVNVFSGATGSLVAGFRPYPAAFTGGVRVAAADTDGNGRLDILTAAGPGPANKVRSFGGLALALLDAFFAFGSSASGVFIGGQRRS